MRFANLNHMVTRILFDPRRDLTDGTTISFPVTIEATPTGVREDGSIFILPSTLYFSVSTSADQVTLAAPTASYAWRLAVRNNGTIVQTRTVRFPDVASISWAALTDVDPASLGDTPGHARQWDATFAELVQLIGAGGSGYLPLWKANTAYLIGTFAVSPTGQIIQANSTFTSGSTYVAGNWTVVAGGGGGSVSDATTSAKGIVQLAGDLGGTAAAPTVPGLAAKAPLASPAFTGTPTGISKAHVGLGNVDNTADSAKPVSNAQQAALNAKADAATVTSSLAAKADLVGGLVPTSQIPALALTTSQVVANQAAMLALTSAQVQPGDIAVRTDGAGTFILTAVDPSQLANWTRLNAPTDLVLSVNGQQGTVVLAKADLGLGNVDNTTDIAKPVSTAQATAIGVKLDALGAPVTLTASGTMTAGVPNLLDATTGPLTAALPTPTKIGQRLTAERIDTGLNLISFAGTVRGVAAAATLSGYGAAGESIDFEAESLTSWRIVASHKPNAVIAATPALTQLRNRQPGPPVTMIAGTQPGHSFILSTTVSGTLNSNDTSDYVLGNQSVSLLTSTSVEVDVFRKDGTIDMTGKGFVFYLQFGNQSSGIGKIDVQLPSGDGNFTGIVMGGSAYPQESQYFKDGEWGRFFVPWSQIGTTGVRGGPSGTTMTRTAITSIRVRVYNLAGQQVQARLNGIGVYPEPAATFPNGVISLTYDDSYSSQYSVARAHLDTYGWRGTLYPILERIDSGAGYLTSAQIRKLHDLNGWEIGAHATTVANHGLGLPALTPAQRLTEIRTMHDWLVTNGYADSTSYAYPRGNFDTASIADLSRYFESSRTVYGHCLEVVGTPYPHRLRSFNVGGWTATQRRTVVDQVKQGRAWGIFTIHAQVSTVTDTANDITVADHQDLIDYIASSGVTVLPVGEVMRANVTAQPQVVDNGNGTFTY